MDKQKLTLVIVTIVVVIILLGAVLISNRQSTIPAINNNNNLTETPRNTFKDGTYTAEGNYSVHIGPKHISVTITLKNGIITGAEVMNQADDPTSKVYQDQFISGFKTQVIGKNITDVNVTRVSGSSLTPQGFNDALTKIEAQAKM